MTSYILSELYGVEIQVIYMGYVMH